MRPSDALLTAWFGEHRGFVWGLCYRITGSAADADDLVQETYLRALERGPERLDEPRGWLTRVAVNAARDALRRRKRRGYIGPWLPTPIVTGDDRAPSNEPAVDGVRTLEGRYGLLESVSLAFLEALEALTPTQRAVLLLCDVFDYSAGEAAKALDLSEGNARTIHHRARRAMASYERRRAVPTLSAQEHTEAALQRFLLLLEAGDVRGIEHMLAEDVRAVADGGGAFSALLHPIVGPGRVARFFGRLAASRGERPLVTIRSINGFPAALLAFESTLGRRPPRLVLSVEVTGTGQIAAFRVVASSSKLAAVAGRSDGHRGLSIEPLSTS